MKALTLMIKPASGMCNMRCKYCFYADETGKRQVANYGLMSRETLSGVLKNALAATTELCSIAFQGGEPTLAGVDFFKAAVELANQWNTNGCQLHFSIQTNGLLIDRRWCELFAEHHFLVGVSLDGPKELHDRYRVDAAGKGTFDRVTAAIRLLQRYHVDTNVLTVLTKDACEGYGGMHRFYQRMHLDYQQFIPCLDPLGEARGREAWSLTPEVYGQYLKTAFDLWYAEAMKGRKRYHRYFDNLLFLLAGQRPEACGMSGVCGLQYVVEADGSVFPCDFYMLDQYRLGNLATDSLAGIDQRRAEIGFIEESAAPDEGCRGCQWLALCRGGCRRDRDYFDAGLGRNYFCQAYREFFSYAAPRLLQLSRMVSFA